jgi:hypothetical protein
MQQVCHLQLSFQLTVFGRLSIRPIIINAVQKALLSRLEALPLARILFFMQYDAL